MCSLLFHYVAMMAAIEGLKCHATLSFLTVLEYIVKCTACMVH